MRTLHLTLKREFFVAIKEGRKLEEYREAKPYWNARLTDCRGEMRVFSHVQFTNGYSRRSPRMTVECLGIEKKNMIMDALHRGEVKTYFVIKLGKVLEGG